MLLSKPTVYILHSFQSHSYPALAATAQGTALSSGGSAFKQGTTPGEGCIVWDDCTFDHNAWLYFMFCAASTESRAEMQTTPSRLGKNQNHNYVFVYREAGVADSNSVPTYICCPVCFVIYMAHLQSCLGSGHMVITSMWLSGFSSVHSPKANPSPADSLQD